MKYEFFIKCSQLVHFDYLPTLDPKDFLYCADITELLTEITDKVYEYLPMANVNTDRKIQFLDIENIGTWFDFNEDFIKEWQQLKQNESLGTTK